MPEVKPLCIDLFCGLGGWADGFLAEGYRVIGFDIVLRPYPGQLVVQDVMTLDGSRFRDAVVIVASPPCDEFSRWDQPWTRARNPPPPDLTLWHQCRVIAGAAKVPLIVENVRGAQRWCGTANAHFGKQYLWGDVPAILPAINGLQNEGRQKQTLSSTRKAERAKIPFPLAQHIARVFKP
jgi:hypothetical protein